MNKASWKYKRKINQLFYAFRHYPKLSRALCWSIYIIRKIFIFSILAPGKQNTLKIIGQKNGYLYVANPKVATRSMIGYLEQYDDKDADIRLDVSYEDIAQQIPLESLYKFSFVRNPWARVYSCWKDKISNQNKFCDIGIITRFEGLYPDMPFADFVEWLASEEGGDEQADGHWLSQHVLLSDSKQVLSLDFIGKLENIDTDASIVFRRIGVGPDSLPHLNRSNVASTEYRMHYSSHTEAIVKKRYARDIELFGYDF